MEKSGSGADLGTLLLKPVKRILKYPLFLLELIKTCFENLFNNSVQ